MSVNDRIKDAGGGQPSLICPLCGNRFSCVVDSRPSKSGKVIRRRRGCTKCKQRYTSYEIVTASPEVWPERLKKAKREVAALAHLLSEFDGVFEDLD